MPHANRRNRAFSLLELLAVVTIIGIVAAVVLPRITGSATTAKSKTCFHNRAQINAAVERWYVEKGVWPNSNPNVDMGADPNYFPEGIPTCPVSGNAYQLSPTTHRVIGHSDAGKGGFHP